MQQLFKSHSKVTVSRYPTQARNHFLSVPLAPIPEPHSPGLLSELQDTLLFCESSPLASSLVFCDKPPHSVLLSQASLPESPIPAPGTSFQDQPLILGVGSLQPSTQANCQGSSQHSIHSGLSACESYPCI